MAPHILIIEDSVDFADFLRAVLELEGYSIDHVTLLHEGFKLARSSPPPDLVLLDLSLPDGDGLEFFDQLELRGLRVIAMTSMTEDEIMHQLQTVGASHFIKPIAADALLTMVKQALGSERL